MAIYTELPLMTQSGKNFYLCEEDLKEKANELTAFLCDIDYMQDRSFAIDILFPAGIKTGNDIEGESDSLAEIMAAISTRHEVGKTEITKIRIINLYRAYKFIIKNEPINKDNFIIY